MGLVSILVNVCLLLFWIRAAVRNEGHMLFNRPYQRVVRLLEPIRERLGIPIPLWPRLCVVAMLLVVGFRGILWSLLGMEHLNFQVTQIAAARLTVWEGQLLSLIAAVHFLLKVYGFLVLAMLVGRLEHRTDHYSRLMRALLGPLRSVPPAIRWLIPLAGLVVFWAMALFALGGAGFVPAPLCGRVGHVVLAVPFALTLALDLAAVWVVVVIAAGVLGLVSFWRPPVADVVERLAAPVVRPFQRIRLRWGNVDLAPLVAILALLGGRWLLQRGLEWMFAAL